MPTDDRITDREMDELRRLRSAGTKGRWERYGYIGESGLAMVRAETGKDHAGRSVFADVELTRANLALACAAVNSLEPLLNEIERLRDELDAYKSWSNPSLNR